MSFLLMLFLFGEGELFVVCVFFVFVFFCCFPREGVLQPVF